MKAKRLILTVLIVSISILSITAQDIIPVDSTHLLNRKQKFTLKYAKNPRNIFGADNSVELPVEVKKLIGDTTNNKLLSFPQWDKAHFINNTNCSARLIIPLEAKSVAGILKSELQVIYDEDESIISRLVFSDFIIKGDSVTEKMLIKSNIRGKMLDIIVYDDNNNIIAEIKGKNATSGVVAFWGTHPELRKRKNKSYDKIYIPNGLHIPSVKQELKIAKDRYEWSSDWTKLKH